MTQDGAAVTAQQDVQARPGECLTSRAVAVAPGATGAATPEDAVRSLGFGRDVLSRQDDGSQPRIRILERTDDQTVGSYSTFRLPDGTWIVDGYVTSVPNTP